MNKIAKYLNQHLVGNVFERPEVTAITSIDFDHMEVLGDTLPAIAEQKAGILKRGVPVIASVKDQEARNVLGFLSCSGLNDFFDIKNLWLSVFCHYRSWF